jgi:hypothetical protein
MSARQESDFELGTYSICGTHKNWLLVVKLAEGIETGESSHIGYNTGVEGGFNERPNPGYQLIGSIKVNPCLFIQICAFHLDSL